jgi:hypothetical protein
MNQTLIKFFQQLVCTQQSEKGKPFYLSKRFWTFALSLVCYLAQLWKGYIIDPQAQILVLIVVNFIVGLLTKSPTGFAWAEDNSEAPAPVKQGGDPTS